LVESFTSLDFKYLWSFFYSFFFSFSASDIRLKGSKKKPFSRGNFWKRIGTGKIRNTSILFRQGDSNGTKSIISSFFFLFCLLCIKPLMYRYKSPEVKLHIQLPQSLFQLLFKKKMANSTKVFLPLF
jgi:hypothetical protein